MKNVIFIAASFLVFFSTKSTAQTKSVETTFTWEGSPRGNKAVWKIDDTTNVYKDVGGVDVTVNLIDPFGQNTTTRNPSEFGDYTKTNSFYGRGALAFQITATGHKQPVCLQFTFSEYIVLENFTIWDIDNIASKANLASNFQDSVSFIAFNEDGEAKLALQPLSKTPAFDILGQSILAKYLPGVNGDLSYRDSTGAVTVNSVDAINTFTLCYANGSADDGLSNSQAMRINEFRYKKAQGSIAGYVLEDLTDMPLQGSRVSLYDENGAQVLDENGQALSVATDKDGYYFFDNLPLGKYVVKQVNLSGYITVNDADGRADDEIFVHLVPSKLDATDNNFYDKLSSALPVKVQNVAARWLSKGYAALSWTTLNEVNNAYFSVAVSDDNQRFTHVGQVYSKNSNSQEKQQYSLDFPNDISGISYISLSQTDFDGTVQHLGTVKLLAANTSNALALSPNPASNNMEVTIGLDEVGIALFTIVDMNGKQIKNGSIIGQGLAVQTIDVSELPNGTYIFQVTTEGITKAQKFMKI